MDTLRYSSQNLSNDESDGKGSSNNGKKSQAVPQAAGSLGFLFFTTRLGGKHVHIVLIESDSCVLATGHFDILIVEIVELYMEGKLHEYEATLLWTLF